MTAETLDIITKAVGLVGCVITFIYLLFVVRGVYTVFGKPIDEHTKKIDELEKRINDIASE